VYIIVRILYYHKYNGTNKNQSQTDMTTESLTKGNSDIKYLPFCYMAEGKMQKML